MSTNGIFHSIDKLTAALFAAPGALAARVRIRQSNYALFRAANYPASRMFLLRHKPSSGRYETGTEIPEHWHVEFLQASGHLKFSFAVLDGDYPNFSETITGASFIAFGEPDADGDMEVFEIAPDKRDLAAPCASSVCWTIIATKNEQERYNVQN